LSQTLFLTHFPDVSRETIEKLQIYEALLKERGQTLSLVGRSTLDEVWTRHFLDSAQLIKYLDEGAIVDIGTGAGFPGMILAIMTTSNINLVENNQKKIDFLRAVAAATDTPVTLHNVKIEALKPFAVAAVTARAVAPLKDLLRLTAPWLKAGATGLFLKGRNAATELEEAGRAYRFSAETFPSLTAPDSQIVKVKFG
jgi:16S rRNA (guanine527-N7)-methyltransferase